MLSTTLVRFSNLGLYSAMAVFTVAMLMFAFHLAALGPVNAERSGGARARRSRELVGAGGASRAAGRPGPTSVTASVAGDAGGAEGADSPVADGPEAASPRARKLAGIALSLSWLGTFLLVASVVMRGLAVMRPPWGNMFEFATAGCAAAALAYCALARRNRWEWLGIFVIGPILLTLGLALFAFYTEAAELMPALKSVWLIIHVIVAILAVAVFTIGFSVGIVYLVKRRREEHPPTKRNFVETLPSAASLERTAYGLNMVGFILWTFTLVAGAIWAQKAWSAYWTWDPKEVWTFVIWVVYAAYMHARATAGWEPRRAMVIALVGYVCVLLNFTVVNLLFTGLHSYSGLK
ncbi:MAG: c-type cytochrome biogenesis protein CcsB [Actinomycetota bacterium]|nr:c-type cytochrome biogenesis protein CcsB [Actinomycetota bacterium]